MKSLTIHNLSEDICSLEAVGLSKVFMAYANYCPCETIMDGGIGFNENSGYVYIALENGVTIASCLGQDVVYIVTNFDTGHEEFLELYHEAIEYQF